MTNPKLIFKDDKLFVIDAPERPESCYPQQCKEGEHPTCFSEKESRNVCSCRASELNYLETLSKAPRWQVKNQDEARELLRLELRGKTNLNKYLFDDWMEKEEQSKLYDLPEGYSIKFEKSLTIDEHTEFVTETLALLIPQAEAPEPFDGSAELLTVEEAIQSISKEKVKEESQEDLWLGIKRGIINRQFGARATHQGVITEWEINFLAWFEKEIESKFIIKRKL